MQHDLPSIILNMIYEFPIVGWSKYEHSSYIEAANLYGSFLQLEIFACLSLIQLGTTVSIHISHNLVQEITIPFPLIYLSLQEHWRKPVFRTYSTGNWKNGQITETVISLHCHSSNIFCCSLSLSFRWIYLY